MTLSFGLWVILVLGLCGGMRRRCVVSDKLIDRSEELETYCSAQEMIEAIQGYVDKYQRYGSVDFSATVNYTYNDE
jgi:hypothetical protein